jgi:hypothetical protein
VTQTDTTPAPGLAVMIPPCGVPEHRMRDIVDPLVGVALRLAGIIHLDDPRHAVRLMAGLDDDQRAVLPYVLAAMVDIDKTPGELLGWAGYIPGTRIARVTAVAPANVLLDKARHRAHDPQCGTRGGYLAHKRRGEDPDDCPECVIANQAWLRSGETDAA